MLCDYRLPKNIKLKKCSTKWPLNTVMSTDIVQFFCKMVQIVRWMYEKNPITGPKELGLSSKNIEYVKSWSVHL